MRLVLKFLSNFVKIAYVYKNTINFITDVVKKVKLGLGCWYESHG